MTSKSLLIDFLPTQYLPISSDTVSFFPDSSIRSISWRRLILYGFVYDIDYSDLRDYNATLGKISGNLNQIAKRMNATRNVYKADVEEVKNLMKQVWDTQLAMLKKHPSLKQ